MFYFLPDFYFNTAMEIDLDFLKRHKIKAVLLDIDNTISLHNKIYIYDWVDDWIYELKKLGIKVLLISNSIEKRVSLFARTLKVDYYISDAKKPFITGFNKALKILDVEKKDVLVIGDQIFTDILGANLAGIKSCLVNPKDKNEPMFIKLKRIFESPFRFLAKRKSKKG